MFGEALYDVVFKEKSKSFSLYTIALAREAKLWEDTRDCQGKRRVKWRKQHRPPPGEVGGAKLLT